MAEGVRCFFGLTRQICLNCADALDSGSRVIAAGEKRWRWWKCIITRGVWHDWLSGNLVTPRQAHSHTHMHTHVVSLSQLFTFWTTHFHFGVVKASSIHTLRRRAFTLGSRWCMFEEVCIYKIHLSANARAQVRMCLEANPNVTSKTLFIHVHTYWRQWSLFGRQMQDR